MAASSTVPGESWNRKITERDDLEWVRSWLATEVGSMSGSFEVRVGHGFDVHRAGSDPGRPLVLGGCVFPGLPGLVGHSDGDAIAHAIADGLLGATGLGDLGQLFPDTDPGVGGCRLDRAVAAGRGDGCRRGMGNRQRRLLGRVRVAQAGPAAC